MSVEVEAPTQVTVSKVERTWRTTQETPYGKPYSLSVHRETVINGLDVPPQLAGDYTFPFDDIKNVPVTVQFADGPKTLTIAQIAAFSQVGYDQLVAARKAELQG